MPLYSSTKDIKKNKLFSGVKDSILKSFFDQKEIKEVREGEIIYKTGDNSNAIYLIIKGQVRVKFSSNNYVINKMFNDFFGEKEVVDNTKRVSSALAYSNLTYYRLDKSILKNLIVNNSSIDENLKKYGEIELPELSLDLDKKSKIFERDKPISFKAFFSKPSVEENKQKEKEPPSVMTQQLLPDLESIDESIEEEDITLEEELEITEEKFKEIEELTEKISEKNETPIEVIEETKSATELQAQSPDDSLENEDEDIISEPLVNDEIEPNETGINREIVRKMFQGLNRIQSSINILDLITNTQRAIKDLTNSESADIILIDENLSSMQRITKKEGKYDTEFFKLSDGLTGSCALQKIPYNYDRPTADNRFNSKIDQPGAARLKRILYFPVISNAGETVAVIQSARENKKYNEEEISYLSMISKQIEAAISRTRAIEKLINEEKFHIRKKLGEIISAEIKVPIDIIDSYIKIMSQKKLPSDTDDIIRMLQKQAASVQEITDTIFKVLEKEFTLENNKIHFNEFIDDVLELLSEYCETRNTKLFKKIGDGAVVYIDRSKLYTAIFHLLKTCVDESKKSGKIYFSTELIGENISISIQNEGVGILAFPDGDIIDNFYNRNTIKENDIGLLIAKKIISAHSGEIHLESIKGVGTTFRLTIPIAKQ